MSDDTGPTLASAATQMVVAALAGDAVSAGMSAAGVLVQLGVAKDLEEKRRRQAERVLEQAAEEAGGPEALAAKVGTDPALLELLERTIQAGARAVLEDKVAALGKVLAEGTRGEALVDVALVLAGALEDLEAPHVQLLDLLGQRGQEPQVTTAPWTGQPGWDSDRILTALPQLKPVLPSVTATLERHALVVNVTRGSMSGVAGYARWDVSPLGVTVLRLLNRDPGREGTTHITPR